MKKILVVEDEKPLRSALELKLSAAGFAVTAVEDGNAAMTTLKSATFDLILTDLIMPHTDGFELLEFLKKEGIATPIIVMSNLEQEEDKKRALSLGAREYIVKSNTPLSVIVEELRTLFGTA